MTTMCCLSASAQRTMNGQSSLCPSVHWTGSSFGAEAFFSQYTLGGFWEAGLSVKQYKKDTSAGVDINSLNIAAIGNYLFRLAGTRSRSINLYGGAGAFLGYEAIDPMHKLPSTIQTNIKNGYFLYGLQAKLVAEFFIAKKVAIVIDGCVPVNFSSPMGWFHYDLGVGLKFLL